MSRVPDALPTEASPDAPSEAEAFGTPRAAGSWGRTAQNVAIVLWPSFLVAAVATMFFFAVFDPPTIGEGTALGPLLAQRELGYAFGFFVFWALAAASSSITLYLARTQRPEPGPRVEPWMRDIP